MYNSRNMRFAHRCSTRTHTFSLTFLLALATLLAIEISANEGRVSYGGPAGAGDGYGRGKYGGHKEGGEEENNSDGISPPNPFDKAASARWLAHNTGWCSISTINSRDRKGSPFGNIASFSDGARDSSTGSIYMLHSSLDASIIDVMDNNLISFSVSEMQTGYCQGKEYDAEDPRCARLSIGGRLVEIASTDEIETAKVALFDKHPGMKSWYRESDDMGHDFRFWKIDIEEIWLVDFFGGAALIDVDAWNRGTDSKSDGFLKPTSISVQREHQENESGSAGDVGTHISFSWFAVTSIAIVAMGLGFFLGRNRKTSAIVASAQSEKVELVPKDRNPVV